MSRPPRLDPCQYVGGRPFFLTICTHQRRQVFIDPAVVRLVLSSFLQTADRQHVEITTYCFMPDHLHALVTGCDADTDLRTFVALAKQRAAYDFARDRRSRLWQEGYFDRAIRQDEAVIDVIAYILGNPLRAALVAHIEDYPHWGSSRWTRAELLEHLALERRG